MPEVLAARSELASLATFVAVTSFVTALFLWVLHRRRPVANLRTRPRRATPEPMTTPAALTTPLLLSLVVGAGLLLMVVAPLSRVGTAMPLLMSLGIPGLIGLVYASRRRPRLRTIAEDP